MKLSIITPTQGKRERELARLVAFTAENLRDRDEHLIVWDCDISEQEWGLPSIRNQYHLFRRSKESVYGNIQRDYAALYASGECLVYCDDDDMLTKEAIDILHSEAYDPEVCHTFQMQDGEDLYTEVTGGPQIVIPNRDDIPRWATTNRYESDKDVIKACREKFRIVHHETVICQVRPRNV